MQLKRGPFQELCGFVQSQMQSADRGTKLLVEVLDRLEYVKPRNSCDCMTMD